MKNWNEMLKNRKAIAAICGVAVAVIAIGVYVNREPKFPTYIDTMNTVKEGEVTPLDDTPQPIVETKTSTKTDNKTVRLAKASTKSYTKNLGTKTTTTKKTADTADAKILTEEKKDVSKKETYTKGSKTKKVTTQTTITVTTTTTKKAVAKTEGTKTATQTGGSTGGGSKSTGDIYALAQGMDSRILSAFDSLGFSVIIDPTFNQGDGYFDAKSRTITLKDEDRGHAIHEMGHFLAFINGISQKSKSLMQAYSGEKNGFPGTYFLYATSDPNEYFAECTREYFLSSNNKAALSKSCPNTIKLLEACINNIDSSLLKDIARRYK